MVLGGVGGVIPIVLLEHKEIIMHKQSSHNTTIQGVTGGTDQISGECSLGQTIPI